MKKGKMTRPLTKAERKQRKAACEAMRAHRWPHRKDPLTQREREVLYVARRLKEREGMAGYGRIAKVFGLDKSTIQMVAIRLQKKGVVLG